MRGPRRGEVRRVQGHRGMHNSPADPWPLPGAIDAGHGHYRRRRDTRGPRSTRTCSWGRHGFRPRVLQPRGHLGSGRGPSRRTRGSRVRRPAAHLRAARGAGQPAGQPPERDRSGARRLRRLLPSNCVEYLEALLGCFKIRAVPVNINYRYVADELEHLFNDAGLRGRVCRTGFRAQRGRRSPRMSRAAPDAGDRGRRSSDPPRRAAPTSLRGGAGRGLTGTSRRRRAAATTTCTSSTPAVPPGCPRASCGGWRTRSSAASPEATRCG